MPFADRPIGEFLDAVAAGKPTPGGGAGAAIAGAAGAALCEMVCSITVSRADDQATTELADLRQEIEDHRGRLLELADADSAAVEALMAPDAGHGDGSERAGQRAVSVPLETAERCLEVVTAAERIVTVGYPPAVGDAHTGALLANAALEASLTNARINLSQIEDAEFAQSSRERIALLDRERRAAIEAVKTAFGDRMD